MGHGGNEHGLQLVELLELFICRLQFTGPLADQIPR
jgi:hypothetical protein